ncbi:hypothetical protein PV325_005589 [Microctonus aethiopoides]|uniref:Ubiquitin carboxyl-terminal hydrolase 47 n=1 Tax=Microctonus aethiopoides TaxID=144406 RepID=A0AA39FX31_9HYME|nr:hypothetical protein PV325_005589 [Microctonus aethiopoides]KAK0177201.1 hypothetical protein PV328_001278 [Microctonus aethiopoides]
MVVVAGDDGHEMPMCVMKRDKGCPSLLLPKIDNFKDTDNRRYMMEFPTNISDVLVIVGKESPIEAHLNDSLQDLPVILKFHLDSTVRQIKYAIASFLIDSPALDSFNICIREYSSSDTLELIGDNKTIEEFNYITKKFMKYKIFVIRIEKENQIEHRRVCINDNYLQIRIIDSSVSSAKEDVNKLFFVSETTTVGQLIESLYDERASFGYKPTNIILRYDNIKIDIANSFETLKDVGFDFSEYEVITIDLNNENSTNVPIRRKTMFLADDDDEDDEDEDDDDNDGDVDHNNDKVENSHSPKSTEEGIIKRNGTWARRECSSSSKEMTFAEIFMTQNEEFGPRESPETETKPEIVYVGLINQAMTCYLNSLIQALYMTPEFRNALYNWEYVDGSEKDAANSIPYQLQKLFLNLQTSKKNAVETTSLTKSFGWDSTEAWQQHDIQELCRVMFDALEQKFKNTKQADLINRLYEGKMIDYVKCLECGTEKSREDTFLDIPLPVKPFGSSVAYNSVEEAMRAFVQPETLDGVNQYFCETCNKKCDAHKGLKFTKFPYILTLHLKRFDFDYNTFHRIKLNDKVTFPDILNVNSLIPSSTDNNQDSSPSTEEDAVTGIKCDDSSTTDSGHLDECLPCDNGIGTNENTISNNEQNDDEGIYISNCPSTSSIHSQENERNRSNRDNCGFYKYDLFSIMIHSGSASGGHYYAYIKDFKTQQWLCFNDQNVLPITYDDIQKTYGGGPSRTFYSGAYSTSTNAYMLMYRQIDYERNCLPMRVEDFPKHIQLLLKQMKEQEEKKNHERTRQMYKINVYCHHPVDKILCSKRIFSEHEELLSDTVEKVYSTFNFGHVVNLDQCRLVNYDATHDVIECSYDKPEEITIGAITQANTTYEAKRLKAPDMLLEIRKKDEKFEKFHANEISTTVFVTDVVNKKIIDGPYIVRVPWTMSVADYKMTLSKWIHFYPQYIGVGENLVKFGPKKAPYESQLQKEGFFNGCKVFVDSNIDKKKSLHDITPKSMLDLYEHMVMLHVQMPDTSEKIMKEFNIPAWENRQVELESEKSIGIVKLSNTDVKIEKNDVELTIQKTEDETIGENEEWQEQSNSEDSSLSDSDRTLVGDASEDDELAGYLANMDQASHSQSANDKKDNDENLVESFMRVGEKYGDPVERLKIYVHKDISRNALKKHLEPIIKVPIKYFKLVRLGAEKNEPNGIDLRTPSGSFEDGETLTVNLCRAIRDGDFVMKLYVLNLKRDSVMNNDFLCEFIVFKNSTIAQVKRELIVELKKIHNINIPYERLRLRIKNWTIPMGILLDDMTIDSCMKIHKGLNDFSFGEFFIQQLSSKEIVTNPCQIVLFAWRYYSVIDDWDEDIHEIVLDNPTTTELKTKLSEVSGIPIDRITFTKGRWPIESSYEHQVRRECLSQWTEFTDDEWPFQTKCSGTIFFKDISEDDSSDATHLKTSKARQRVPRARFHDPNWSPRRERALKIFVDDK